MSSSVKSDDCQVVSITEEATSYSNSPGETAYNFGNITTETFDVPVFQKKDNSIFVVITFPTAVTINSCLGVTFDGKAVSCIGCVASPHGQSTGYPFDSQTRFAPGDYSLGFIYSNPEDVEKISYIRTIVNAEVVSNFVLCQAIFGLYRALGFEPSHVMKYPVRSVSAGTPFYRKIEKILKEELKSTTFNQEKGGSDHLISLNEINELYRERDRLLAKLTEVEDQIEYLSSKQ